MSFCTECGEPASPKDNFCEACGHKIKHHKEKLSKQSKKVREEEDYEEDADAVLETKKIERRLSSNSTEKAVLRGLKRYDAIKKANKLFSGMLTLGIIGTTLVFLGTGNIYATIATFCVILLTSYTFSRVLYGLPLNDSDESE